MTNKQLPDEEQLNSCDGTITRKEFVEKVLKTAAVAGTLIASPKILDKFLIPPAYAAASSCNTADTQGCTPGSEVAFGGGVLNSGSAAPSVETLCIPGGEAAFGGVDFGPGCIT